MQFTNNSLFFPDQKIIYLESVDSTNRFAKDLVSNSRPVADGTVILAGFQTSGRGQMSTSWHSDKGQNLLCSIIVSPQFLQPEQQFSLNKVVSLSIFDLLRQMNLDVSIKWPNDIVCSQGKLAGILIENILQGSRIKASVIGIGLNLNQTDFSESAGNPFSLRSLTGKSFEAIDVLEEFFIHFGRRYQQLYKRTENLLHHDYLHALLGFNELKQYEADGRLFTGKITGISEKGELELESGGKIKHYWFKEIKLVPAADSVY